MRPDAFEAKWQNEADTMGRRLAQVDAAALLREVLADFRAVVTAAQIEVLDLQEASRESGYSADHLGRLVREGKIRNAGRKHAPRIRRADLPLKAGALRLRPLLSTLPHATPGQIARAVVTSDPEGEAR